MLNRLSSTLLARLLALAMVLTVGFHAAQPVERPLTPVSGSAFSAATSDVAVASTRRSVAERATIAAEPLVLASLLPARPLAVFPLVHANHLRPDPTGPPVLPPLQRGPSPRAPPLA